MSAYYIGLALFGGAMLTLQIGINANLSKYLNSPNGAAALSFAIGTIALVAFLLLSRSALPALATIRAVPLWAFTGGVLGAIYVAITIFCAPQLGSTLLIVLVVTGQMAIALLLDHYGLIGFPVRAMNLWRILGVGFVLSGVVLIVKN